MVVYLTTWSFRSSARQIVSSAFASVHETPALTAPITWRCVPACSSRSLNFFQESAHVLRPHDGMRLLEGGSWLGSPPWVPTVRQGEPLKGIRLVSYDNEPLPWWSQKAQQRKCKLAHSSLRSTWKMAVFCNIDFQHRVCRTAREWVTIFRRSEEDHIVEGDWQLKVHISYWMSKVNPIGARKISLK